MSIKTNKTITIDDKTIIENPEVIIKELRVFPDEKRINVICVFQSGKTVIEREVGLLKYSSDWTILDIENFITEFLSDREVKESITIKK